MKHRTEEEITALILESANGRIGKIGATQTTIMYKAFLTFTQLKDYLSFLMERELLEYDKLDRVYNTTEKGKRFLQMYNQISDVIIATKQIG
jgi:predicted transcriptional regulator